MHKKLSSLDYSLWLWVLALWAILLGKDLFAQGLFVDGLYYGTIARNFCFEGNGYWDFWLTKTQFNPFYSHPPLAFWLQASVFSLLGDVWYCDRVYSLLTFIFSSWALLKIWTLREKLRFGWLPLMALIFMPLSFWSFSNNLLENTLCCFALWSSYWILKSCYQKNWSISALIATAFCLFAASLAKGPVGLFPLAIPFLYYFLLDSNKDWKKALGSTLFLTLFLFGAYYLMFSLSTEAKNYFQGYWKLQLLGSISGEHGGQGNRFFILYKLVEELAIPIIGTIVLYFIYRMQPKKKAESNFKQVLFWVAIALSASLPLMVSPKQMGFYLLPSLPFWALAFSQYLIPLLPKSASNNKIKVLSIVALIILLLSPIIAVSRYKLYARDQTDLEAVFSICKLVPQQSIIGLAPELEKEWKLYGYFYRYGYISLEWPKNQAFQLQLQDSNEVSNCKLVYEKRLRLIYCEEN